MEGTEKMTEPKTTTQEQKIRFCLMWVLCLTVFGLDLVK
jgi:hypothetical protein